MTCQGSGYDFVKDTSSVCWVLLLLLHVLISMFNWWMKMSF